MKLWIRSQDKRRLILTKDLSVRWVSLDTNICTIVIDTFEVGTYKNEERAIEVLDEIQNLIKPTLITTEFHNEIKPGKSKNEFDLVMTPSEEKIEILQPNVVVYEMPKE